MRRLPLDRTRLGVLQDMFESVHFPVSEDERLLGWLASPCVDVACECRQRLPGLYQEYLAAAVTAAPYVSGYI